MHVDPVEQKSGFTKRALNWFPFLNGFDGLGDIRTQQRDIKKAKRFWVDYQERRT
jgi:hypothetical protein